MLFRVLLINLLSFSLFSGQYQENNSEKLGSWVGPYQITKKLGRGACGTVFEAIDLEGNFVALKIYHDTEWKDDLERIHSTGQKIQHPNILQSIGIVSLEDFELSCLVLELVEGRVLEKIPELTHEQALSVLFQFVDGIYFAFSQGFKHVDLNEQNIMLDKNGCVKIIDIDSFFAGSGTKNLTDFECKYFDETITNICIGIINKIPHNRNENFFMRMEIKKLAWDYIEDLKEGKPATLDWYFRLLVTKIEEMRLRHIFNLQQNHSTQ